MKKTTLFVAFFTVTVFAVAEEQFPSEVQSFIVDRETCDHFRGEPIEGNEPSQIERRRFVQESMEIFCAGTDRRLAALKRRYSIDPLVMKRLLSFESNIEGNDIRTEQGAQPDAGTGRKLTP